jgi:hypothetical protein
MVARLKKEAGENGHSLAQECETRLERSLDADDTFGGPELRRIAYAMATAFAIAGQYSAGRDVPVREWLHTVAGITAMVAVVDTLAQILDLDEHGSELAAGQIRGQLITRLARRRAK